MLSSRRYYFFGSIILSIGCAGDVQLIPDTTLQAWKDAGAKFTWRSRSGMGGYLTLNRGPVQKQRVWDTALPAFNFDPDLAQVNLKNLPAPGVPFAVGLSDCKITDKELGGLIRFSTLTGLDLTDTSITDVGLLKLAGLKQLAYVRVHGTKVTSNGIEKLQSALPHCKIITDPYPVYIINSDGSVESTP
jgi:hypothetical protein